MSAHPRSWLYRLALACALLPSAVRAQPGASLPADAILDALGAHEGSTICEIGAGNGELSLAAARRVGPQGRVYSSELGDDHVRELRDRVAATAGITVVAGDPVKTNFPDGACDALFMRNVYHHFDDPAAMDASIAAALRPGGRVAIIDFRPNGQLASRPSDRDQDGSHGVTAEAVSRELEEAGFSDVSTTRAEERWFMVVGTRP
jgi:SAM-dependent methyltransferase